LQNGEVMENWYLLFLDDGLAVGVIMKKALLLSNELKQGLLLSGFIPNANKNVFGV
jgi:hypothetical protein